jgi:hypothetical protein
VGRSLSVGGLILAALSFLVLGTVQPAQGLEVADPSSFRSCLENSAAGGPTSCEIVGQAVASTTGTAPITAGIFAATLPTGRVLDVTLDFAPASCLIWDHRATFPSAGEPANAGSAVEVVKITAPSGVSSGSRLTIRNLCVKERRDGAAGGGSNTSTVMVSISGAGSSALEVSIVGEFQATPESGGLLSGSFAGDAFTNPSDAYGMLGEVGTEETLEYIYGLKEFPAASLSYQGGAKVFYVSQTTGGLIPTVGNDTNPGSWAAPILTCSRVAEIVDGVPGARIYFDSGDGDWVDNGAGNCQGLMPSLTPTCDGSLGFCALISPIDASIPLVIDATGSSERAIGCVATTAGASLALQNVSVENQASNDVFYSGEQCELVVLNGVCDGLVGNGSDNCATGHESSATWILGDRTVFSNSGSGTGANPLIANGTGSQVHIGIISRGLFQHLNPNASDDIINPGAGSSGSAFVIGAELASGTNNADCFELNPAASGSTPDDIDVRAARVLCQSEGTSSRGFFVRASGSTDRETIRFVGHQITVAGFAADATDMSGFVQHLNGALPAANVVDWRCFDCLADDISGDIIDQNESATYVGSFFSEFQGVIDEDDNATTFEINDVTYATLALARAAYDSDLWEIGTDASYADLGGTGTQCSHRHDDCGSPTVTMPTGVCHAARECATQAQPGHYAMQIQNGRELRHVIPGKLLRGFALERGNIGAR